MPRILLIEDNPADVYLIREALLRTGCSGFEIDSAGDGDEAMEKLECGTPPVLVVLDLNLPKMEGANLVSRIRLDPRLSRTLVVTWTSSAIASESRELLELGADRHIVKPLEWEEYEKLGAALSDLIARGRETGEGAAC